MLTNGHFYKLKCDAFLRLKRQKNVFLKEKSEGLQALKYHRVAAWGFVSLLQRLQQYSIAAFHFTVP